MKELLDKFVTDNHDKLMNIAKSKLVYFGVDIEPETIMTDAYIYVLGKLPLPKADIPKYFVNYMNIELMYPQSQVRRRERIVDHAQLEGLVLVVDEFEPRDMNQISKDFKNTLGRIEQIVWEVYSEKDIRESRQFSEHFNLTHTSGYLILREVLTKFKKFYKNYED